MGNKEGGNVDARVDELLRDAECGAQVRHRDGTVRLEELGVGLDAHLARVVPRVHREEARGEEVVLFDFGWGGGGVSAAE